MKTKSSMNFAKWSTWSLGVALLGATATAHAFQADNSRMSALDCVLVGGSNFVNGSGQLQSGGSGMDLRCPVLNYLPQPGFMNSTGHASVFAPSAFTISVRACVASRFGGAAVCDAPGSNGAGGVTQVSFAQNVFASNRNEYWFLTVATGAGSTFFGFSTDGMTTAQ